MAELNPCVNCKKRGPYRVFMTQDSWVAECRNCGCLIDLGQPPIKGYGNG